MTRNTDLGYLKYHVKTRNQFHRVFTVLQYIVINQDKFRIHWWIHQRGRYIKMGEALVSRPKMLSDNNLGSWIGRS